MRDNLIVGLPNNQIIPEGFPSKQVKAEGISTLLFSYNQYEMGYFKSISLSIVLHITLVVAIWLILLILQFIGINLLTFDRPEQMKDIEFQLVTAPDEKPRNPATRNRAEQNSRSGGEKIPNLREAQSQRKAGTPQPTPKPQPRVSQRQVRQSPTPPQPTPMVTHQPSSEQSQPAPPRPRATAPKNTTRRQQVAAVPNPLAPVNIPDAPGPVANTGPLVRGPAGGSSTGSSTGSSVGPATIPGQFSSGGGQPSAGSGPSGQGGQGNFSQHGSPGGGGGRPGIDALAEPDFGPYLAELQRRIRRNWNPPEDREDKTVVLLFTIGRDGRLLSITVKRSSGFANADSAARMAVERSAPFRPLPSEYRNNSINVEFTFDYNVYTGKSGGINRR